MSKYYLNSIFRRVENFVADGTIISHLYDEMCVLSATLLIFEIFKSVFSQIHTRIQ